MSPQATPATGIRPIILAGSGRSGTTWLTDMLTLDRNYRSIFEPLHFLNVPNVGKNWGLYLRADDEHPWLHDHLSKCFFTRADRAWMKWMTCRVDWGTPWYSQPFWFLYNLKYFRPWARNRVVKVIKANLMLPWIIKHWNPKILFITRHPGAVLSSRNEMGWKANPAKFLQQPNLVSDYLKSHRKLIRESQECDFRKQTIVWCIENLIPLRQIANQEIQVLHVTYEDLMLHPETSMRSILEYLEYPTKIHDSIIGQTIRTIGDAPEQRIHKWKSRLSSEQQDYLWDALEQFGIQVADTPRAPMLETSPSTPS